jgi:nitric oxide reductase activation protein
MTTALKRNVDGIFINISDGEPAFGGRGIHYGGNIALEHTRTQVERFRNAGYKILSYFVCTDNYWNARVKQDFIHMYGKDSRFIDPVNLNDLAKSLNSTLLAPVYGN